jgi:hypothetical protein
VVGAGVEDTPEDKASVLRGCAEEYVPAVEANMPHGGAEEYVPTAETNMLHGDFNDTDMAFDGASGNSHAVEASSPPPRRQRQQPRGGSEFAPPRRQRQQPRGGSEFAPPRHRAAVYMMAPTKNSGMAAPTTKAQKRAFSAYMSPFKDEDEEDDDDEE